MTDAPLEVRLRPAPVRASAPRVLVPAGIGLATTVLGVGWCLAGPTTGQRLVGLVVLGLGIAWLRSAWRRASAERKRRARLAGAPVRLRLDDHGVTVHHGLPPGSAPATLAWVDLAAVVVSPLPSTGRVVSSATYVQFVPVHEDRVVATGGEESARVTARLCGVSTAAARMVWVVGTSLEDRVDEVVARARAAAPGARVLDSRGR